MDAGIPLKITSFLSFQIFQAEQEMISIKHGPTKFERAAIYLPDRGTDISH
jgi:hypothetical protein